jgi:hypothetical protein
MMTMDFKTRQFTGICKAVLLLTPFIKYLCDVLVRSRLLAFIIYKILHLKDNIKLSTGIFNMDHSHDNKQTVKKSTFANTDGMVNCLRQPGQLHNRRVELCE